jgi:hypothetical protein
VFERDTFAYANGLIWEYYYDEEGKWTHRPREPKPDYSHHCFVVVRAAKEFFLNARFDPQLPVTNAAAYRKLIHRVKRAGPRKELPEEKKIVIPGYANLREFSAAQSEILKAECGSFWQSYFQRGHWRMIWPFSRSGQEQVTEQLVDSINRNVPPIVHVVCFPSLKINHALLLFRLTETEKEIQFAAYDPNSHEAATTLTYDRSTRTFSLPTNFYFPGGELNAYEIYVNWCY